MEKENTYFVIIPLYFNILESYHHNNHIVSIGYELF